MKSGRNGDRFHQSKNEKYGVIHYCVPNISSLVARTASIALSNILTPLLVEASRHGGMESYLRQNIGLRNGAYMFKGCLTNEYLGKKFSMKSMDINLFLSTGF